MKNILHVVIVIDDDNKEKKKRKRLRAEQVSLFENDQFHLFIVLNEFACFIY